VSEEVSVRPKDDDRDETRTPRRRLERFDQILLGTLCPLFIVCFGLHVYAVATDTLVYHSFYTSSAASADDGPTVEGFILEFENLGELEVGDRILAIGGVDTRGASARRARPSVRARGIKSTRRGDGFRGAGCPFFCRLPCWARRRRADDIGFFWGLRLI
jgi:hypothetical protein